MEIYTLNHEIRVFYVTASSFPQGVMKAHQQLHALAPAGDGRNFFGFSYPDGKGSIIYKAAANELYPGEAEKLGCDTFLIRKGDYISELLHNWRGHEEIVGITFRELLAYPGIDKNGYCLEIYSGEDEIRCMVPLS